MRQLLRCLAVAILVSVLGGCSDDPPSARVRNELVTKANIQLKQSNGNTININDVGGGQVSGYRDLVTGRTEVTAVIQDEAAAPTVIFLAEENHNHTIVVVNSTPPTLRVDTESK
jgi:hypothetical protein